MQRRIRRHRQPAHKKPVIVMPELTHFEHAEYPPEAEKAGLQADVMLKLTIDRDGNVTKAEVIEPVGSGFDEAAQAAALKFKFTPATRDGVPIPVVIPVPLLVHAHAEGAGARAPLPPPTHRQSRRRRAPRGQRTRRSRARSSRSPWRTARTRQVTTDEAGKWQVNDLPAGHYKVHVESPGFQPIENQEEVVAGEETEATYRLAPVSEGIEITVQGERPPREVTRRTIERREIERIPGTSGDALRSLQSLPGVARPPGLAGLLIVRGSSPQRHAGLRRRHARAVDLSLRRPVERRADRAARSRSISIPATSAPSTAASSGGIVDVGLRSPDTQCTGRLRRAHRAQRLLSRHGAGRSDRRSPHVARPAARAIV